MLLPGANVGFMLLMLATACLGSWPNFFRAFPYHVRPEFPYFNFTWMSWVVALVLALMFGNTGFDIPDFFENLDGLSAAPLLILWSLLAGACLAIGNMLYLQGMQVTGQTTAAPVAYGISLVLGLTLIYTFDSIPARTSLLLHYLFPGLLLIFAAIVCSCAAQVVKIKYQREKSRREHADDALNQSSDSMPATIPQVNADSTVSLDSLMTVSKELKYTLEEQPEDDEPANVAAEIMMKVLPGPKYQRSQIHAFLVCAIGGTLIGGWRVFSNLALQPLDASADSTSSVKSYLTPYSANFLFFSGSAIGYLIAGPLLLKRPFTGRRGNFLDYPKSMGPTQHWQAIVSGFLFTFGVCLMFLAEQGTGYPVSFIFSQASPLLVSVWGIIYWKEFDDTPRNCKIWLGWMFILYFIGLLVILLSHFPVLSLI